ncbi:MAG: S24 family peptidase, partial [Nocardioides sp.]
MGANRRSNIQCPLIALGGDSAATLLRVPQRSHRVSPYPPRPGSFGLARVRGESMLPTLRPGDRLLVRYAAPVAEGDLVVARFPDGTLSVKRAGPPTPLRDGRPGWWLASDNP